VTPEPVATYVASDMLGWDASKRTLVDAFAGAGGNVIAFALSEEWDRIIAVERDAATLACAQHNAELYGVASQITWVHGDCFEYLSQALAGNASAKLDRVLRLDPATTVVFASPPWGGPGYRTDEVFDLGKMQPYNLATLHNAFKSMDHALYLPRTSDIRQIARLVPDGEKIEVVQYCMEGASKAMVAYIPAETSRTAQTSTP
jgi:trimethylguanosine synthase